jgi:hypothetical protein
MTEIKTREYNRNTSFNLKNFIGGLIVGAGIAYSGLALYTDEVNPIKIREEISERVQNYFDKSNQQEGEKE